MAAPLSSALPASTARTHSSASIRRLPTPSQSDAALVEAVRQGEQAAAGSIWDRYAPLVRRIVRRSLGPSGEIDDNVQDIFLCLFRRLHALRDPAALRSFLIGVAMRVLAAHLRRRKVRRWLTLTAEDSPPEPIQPPADHLARAALQRLYQLLDELSPQTRLAFVLRHIEQLPLVEVAAALEVSLATAKRRLSKARRKLDARAEKDPLLSRYASQLPSRRRGGGA